MIRDINGRKDNILSKWFSTKVSDWRQIDMLHQVGLNWTWANPNTENEWLGVVSSHLWHEQGFIFNSRSFRGNTVNVSFFTSNNHSRCSKVQETIKGL